MGAPSLVFLSMPVVLLISLIAYLGGFDFPNWLTAIAVLNLVVGLIAHAIFAFIVIVKEKWWDMAWCVPLFPLYWVLHSIASLRALWQLFKRPHFWDKTEHGVSKMIAAVK